MIYAILVVVMLVALEDIQDANVFHHWLRDRWGYAQNRWKWKYRDAGGPYDFSSRKWWAKVGLTGFLDLWHLAKTLRVLLVCWLVASWAGLAWWWMLPLWVFYGVLHDHVFYGRLYK